MGTNRRGLGEGKSHQMLRGVDKIWVGNVSEGRERKESGIEINSWLRVGGNDGSQLLFRFGHLGTEGNGAGSHLSRGSVRRLSIRHK